MAVMRPATPDGIDGTRILLGFSSYAPRHQKRFTNGGISTLADTSARKAQFPHRT
jgi:hypothetical protein